MERGWRGAGRQGGREKRVRRQGYRRIEMGRGGWGRKAMLVTVVLLLEGGGNKGEMEGVGGGGACKWNAL